MGFLNNLFGRQDPAPQHQGKMADTPMSGLPAGVVAVDAVQGPMPMHREQLHQARAEGVTTPHIAITGASGVDDELVELVRLEMIELCEAIGFTTEPLIEIHH